MQSLELFDVPTLELPDIQILDVTLRDGGFQVSFDWSLDEMTRLTRSLAETGVDFVELGYIGGAPDATERSGDGISSKLTPQIVAHVHGHAPSVKLAAMIHPDICAPDIALGEFAAAGLSLVRFVFHPSWSEALVHWTARAKEANLDFSINIALASRHTQAEIEGCAQRLSELSPDYIYVADTCSALMPEDVTRIFQRITGTHANNGKATEFGFHGHDFLTLALANSLAAVQTGATIVDSSVLGIGRGAGNLRTELWLALAIGRAKRKGTLSPIVEAMNLVERKLGGKPRVDLMSFVAGSLNLSPTQEAQARLPATEDGASLAHLASILCSAARHYATVPEVYNELLQ